MKIVAMYLTNARGKGLNMKLVMYKFELAPFSKQSEMIQEKHLQYATFLPNCSGGEDSGLVQLGLYS